MKIFQNFVKSCFKDELFPEKVKNMNRKIAVPIFVGVLLLCGLLRMGHAAPNGLPTPQKVKNFTVPENSPGGTKVGTPVTTTSTVDGGTITYTIEAEQSDNDLFSIGSTTGQVTVNSNVILDYEDPNYRDPSKGYRLILIATDDTDSVTLSGFATVWITLTDVVETPPLAWTDGSSATRSVAENTDPGTDIGSPVSATGGTTPRTYSLGGTDGSSFDIVSTTGQLQTKATLDYETKNSYTVQVSVTDSSTTPLTASIAVTINVTNVDENQPLGWTDGGSATRSVAENTPPGRNIGRPVSATGGTTPRTYSLGGTDAASFDIVSTTSQLRTKATLDYETKNSYTVQVSVTDATSQTASITVTINVTNVDENQPPPPPPEPPKPKEVLVIHQQQCGLGWAPQSQYQHLPELPKVMIYALEFEFTNGNYTCSAIEIRTGDATLSHIEGWQLYLGRLYNPSRLPITLTQENSQFTDQILRLTPESLGQQTFACGTLYLSGQPLPSVQYDLKNENNNQIDRAYSCYFWGQTAVTPERHISPRRISSQALQAMDPPRIERYLLDPTKVFGTYIDFAAFGWDRAVLSDWLLAASEASEVGGGNAPSSPYKQLTTSWAALKLRQTDRRHKRR